MGWTTSDIVTLVSLVLLSVVLMVVLPISATANVSNKLEYAVENGYTFYLNGKDITDDIGQYNLMSYDVSVERWDTGVVYISTK